MKRIVFYSITLCIVLLSSRLNTSAQTFPDTPGQNITTQAVSDISTTSATGNGNIIDLGTPHPTAHGICWNTTGTPTITNNKTDNGPSSETGAFTASINKLNPNTTYYVRAYTTNSGRTNYGKQISFNTLEAVEVTTQEAISITTTTATINGNILILGQHSVTACGTCWNTTGLPTLADSMINIGSPSTIGAFTVELKSLNSGTRYYVRNFATNDTITSYGEEISFRTSSPPVISESQLFEVKENANNNSYIGTILATDKDAETSFTNWMIIAGNTDATFAVDSANGHIIIADNTMLDYEYTSSYSLLVSVTDGTNSSKPETIVINITKDVRSAINTSQQNKLSVYPNPCKDLINISGMNLKQATIIDDSGKCIKKTGQGSSINTTDLKRGIYVLTLENSEGLQQTIHLIKE